jgi:hypothetical protein
MKNRRLRKYLEYLGLKIVEQPHRKPEIQDAHGFEYASLGNYGKWFSKPTIDISPPSSNACLLASDENGCCYEAISRMSKRLGLMMTTPEKGIVAICSDGYHTRRVQM